MKKPATLILTILLYSYTYGQTIVELYDKKDYKALIRFEKKSDKLTPDELYKVGFAFFQLENDDKAIEFYDKAISKGLDSSFVRYRKALALRYAKRFEEAIREFDIAIEKAPSNQMYMSAKGLTYYYSGQMDKALSVFLEAQKLPNDYQEPFYMAGHIYHINSEFDMALRLFYDGLKHISKSNKYYLSALTDIGQLEYTVTKDFTKSAKAYEEAINIAPKNYELYTKLIKAYNAGKEYAKADSIFGLMKIAYEQKELPENDMKYKNIAIDEYEWSGQKVIVKKYLVDPKEFLDLSYKVYILTKTDDKIERTFMVEQTIQLPDEAKHLLCEVDHTTGAYITYLYGWETDSIPLYDLKQAIGLVLAGKIPKSASSNMGNE